MNSKGHLFISIAKSGIRIISAAVAIFTKNITVLASGILIAEVLGIAEELVDKRWLCMRIYSMKLGFNMDIRDFSLTWDFDNKLVWTRNY